MKVRLPPPLSAAAVVCVVAVFPYATAWMPFPTGLWVGGGVLVAIVAGLAFLGRHELRGAIANAPRAVRLGLGLYLAAAVYGAALGLAHGNPTRYVITQTASMVILPAAVAGFLTGTRPSLRRLATGLGLGAVVALAVHVGFLVARAGAPSVQGEALRLLLPNDVGFTGTAVMASLVTLAWWSQTRAALAAGACAASACLLVGGMSRGSWVATLGGVAVFWWLSKRRRWWTLAVVALAPLLCVGALLAASSWVWTIARPIVASRVEPAADTPPKTLIDIELGVPVTGGPIEIAYSVTGGPASPPIIVVYGKKPSAERFTLTNLAPNPRAPSQVVRSLQFIPAGVTSVDFCVWEDLPGRHGIRLEARELRGPLAGWVRTLGLRLGSLATAITQPTDDATLEYRVREWEAVRGVWTTSPPLRRLAGQGLGAIVNFPNSSWDERGHRIQVPTASYLHNFYVFLGFKLGVSGIVALAGLLMIAGWTFRAAWSVRSSGGPVVLAAAAACWCAYLVWAVTSPEIINAHTATLLGALVASSLADAAHPGAALPQAAWRSQSSSIKNA